MQYRLQQRAVPVGSEKGSMKWFPVFRHRGRTGYKELVQMAQERGCFSRGDIRGAFYMLQDIIIRQLQHGHSVQLDELGWLTISVSAAGSDHPDDFSSRQIRDVTVNFRPSRQLKAKLQDMKFHQIPPNQER